MRLYGGEENEKQEKFGYTIMVSTCADPHTRVYRQPAVER